MTRPQTRFGAVTLGTVSRIVGVVSQGDTLRRLATSTEQECDIIELRLDIIGSEAPGWLDDAKAIEARGLPVILTIRLAAEGGHWNEPDEARLALLEEGLRHLSAVDIELRSSLIDRVSAFARQQKRGLIVSHHDFEKTPPLDELKRIMTRAARYGTVVKLAVFSQSNTDIAVLRGLLHEKCPVPLCLLGMGPLGTQTRVEFPKLGSCLTYGYLDSPVAPGQVSARELTQLLRKK